jgi:hypothetical protein
VREAVGGLFPSVRLLIFVVASYLPDNVSVYKCVLGSLVVVFVHVGFAV